LTDVEKRCRARKRPEWLRKARALLGPFTVIEILYFIIAAASIGLWITYIRKASSLKQVLEPRHQSDVYVAFQESVYFFQTYSDILSIQTLLLGAKVFDFLNKSSQMRKISNMLYQARYEAIYFVVVFVLLLIGFVGMSYFIFGSSLESFRNFSSALITCF
jgi:hypothetical protein